MQTKKQKSIARKLRKAEIHKLAERLGVDFNKLVKEMSK